MIKNRLHRLGSKSGFIRRSQTRKVFGEGGSQTRKVFGEGGQQLTEFALLFLAVSIAFVGMRLYLRRGVNANLKHIEMQLNEAVKLQDYDIITPPPPRFPLQVKLWKKDSGEQLQKDYTIMVYNNKPEEGDCWSAEFLPEFSCYFDNRTGEDPGPGPMYISKSDLIHRFGIRTIKPVSGCCYKVEFCVPHQNGWCNMLPWLHITSG